MADQSNDSKYFAYYIPENKPILMNNILEKLREEYDANNAQIINEQIQANIQVNDWNIFNSDNIKQCLNSLVLVKFTLVNDIFIDNSTINNSTINNSTINNSTIDNENENIDNTTINNTSDFEKQYKTIAENSTQYKTKYSNKDYSQTKLNQILFSGTKPYNYVLNDEAQYIFSEIIIIPLTSIMNTYVELNFNYNGVNNFDNQLNSYINKGELNNTTIQNILRLTNMILEPVKYSKPYENYRHLQQFIPLLQNEASIIKQLWEEHLYKQPENPYEILQNHKLITNNNIITITGDNSRFTIQGHIYSKLYVTLTKKFNNITYKDALPFKS